MTERICLTCTKLTAPEQLVVVGDHKAVLVALSKHFWFSKDEIQNSILCCSCWGKIDDFQQFYCEIERLYTSRFPAVQGEFVEVKQELHIHEIDEQDSTTIDDTQNDIDGEQEHPTVKKEMFHADQKSLFGDDDYDGGSDEAEMSSAVNELEIKRYLSGGNSSPQKQSKRGNRVERSVQHWRKKLNSERFIAENVNIECDTCAQKYDSFQQLQQHSLEEHQRRAYVFCCKHKFNKKPRLIDHIQFHLNPMQFQCDICLKTFRHSEALKYHKDKLHSGEEKTLQCSVCPKKFSTKKFLNIHEKYHRKLGEKKWHCATCDRYFAYESMLRQHNRTAHSNEYTYVCQDRDNAIDDTQNDPFGEKEGPSVGKEMLHVDQKSRIDDDADQDEGADGESDEDEMSSAVNEPQIKMESSGVDATPEKTKRVNRVDQSWRKNLNSEQFIAENITIVCDTCAEKYESFQQLQQHSLEKHQKRAYVFCCDLKFCTKPRLMDHIQFHLNPLQFQCDICSKTFRHSEALKYHKDKLHSGEEKNLQCSMCPKKFSQQKFLNIHEKYHRKLDEKKWHCATCDRYFAYEYILRQHNRTVHSNEYTDVCQDSTTIKDTQMDTVGEQESPSIKKEMPYVDQISLSDDNVDDEGVDRQSDDGEMSNKGLSLAVNESEINMELSDVESTSQKQRKGGNRVGRPEQSWRKNLNSEQFIAENVNIECDTCAEKYDSFQQLQQHSLEKHQKRAYVFCCDHKFCTKPRLIDHIQFHLNPLQFQCDICLKPFRHSEALKYHKDKMHSGEEKTLQCSMCPKTFSKQKFLNIHEKYHRKLGEKNWHCAICDRYFAYESILRQHNRTVHSNEYTYVCHVCARGFYVRTSYVAHMETHDENLKRTKPPDERVQCSRCGSWVYKKGLRKHMLRHSGTQTCEHCGQECKSEMALRYHLAQHRMGDFKCSLCGKAFKRQLTLKEHMASHTGEVLYQCDFCEKTFNSHANRASHRKKMHPKEWFEDKMRKNPEHQNEESPITAEAIS
ncbi:zinc finger protein 62-like [Toxorhynchites rutilus septentrionalis]|uniref:zinc finger protein 62-like n=1 Tax=Toxorhynchites rutilus septentrionalis TaxID=329112 RepID=UPI00247A2046|nr:zinc finger protein 62-like [Toxorhynchites rutilus septentrionalis]